MSFSSVGRNTEGERIVKRNVLREGKEIGQPSRTAFVISSKCACFPAHCMRYFSLLPSILFKKFIYF